MAGSLDDALGLGDAGSTYQPPEPPTPREQRKSRRQGRMRHFQRRLRGLFRR